MQISSTWLKKPLTRILIQRIDYHMRIVKLVCFYYSISLWSSIVIVLHDFHSVVTFSGPRCIYSRSTHLEFVSQQMLAKTHSGILFPSSKLTFFLVIFNARFIATQRAYHSIVLNKTSNGKKSSRHNAGLLVRRVRSRTGRQAWCLL